MRCRYCCNKLSLNFVDLGTAPPSNAYVEKSSLSKHEKWFPLKIMLCEKCWLVQTIDIVDSKEIFNDKYIYFSSFSKSWLEHSKNYVESVIKRFDLDNNSQVVEIAANDGYLLQYFKRNNIPSLGIEPSKGAAKLARKKGISIIQDFFNQNLSLDLVKDGFSADLTIANNVLAHVPNLNDFIKAFYILLKPKGVATFEFPSLLELIKKNAFDTIYHEHFSYFSLTFIIKIFENFGFEIFDVEELTTHGGSLRIFVQKKKTGNKQISKNVTVAINKEKKFGLMKLETYKNFQVECEKISEKLLMFLIKCRLDQKTVAAYGAAAKGNTLINFIGIKPNLINFVVDKNPFKQNKFLPGSRIPILGINSLKEHKPDYILILPWNLENEIISELDFIRSWGGKFLIAVPYLKVL